MSKQDREKNLEKRCKPRFQCCPCFIRKRSNDPPQFNEILDKNEPYDYIVEKLAIRKVPLSLFSTIEDLEKQSFNSAAITSVMSQKSERSTGRTITEDAAPVKLAPHFKAAPKTEINHVSSSLAQPVTSFVALKSEQERELFCSDPTFHKRRNIVQANDEESLLVSQILSQHASLYTLDSKNAIPKDPERYYDKNVLVPESVRNAFGRQRPHKNKVQVEIHKTSMPSTAYMPSSGKRNMTPDIQNTIQALAHVQKPHTPGFPPRNQKSVLPVRDAATENELQNVYAISQEPLQRMPSYELVSRVPEPVKKAKTVQKDEDEELLRCTSPMVSFNPITVRNSAMQHNEMPYVEAPAFKSQPSYQPYYEQSDKGETSTVNADSSDHCTEISQLQGQNLKWKIIIKHHSDKNSKDGKNPTSRNTSDTDLENEEMVLGGPPLPR